MNTSADADPRSRAAWVAGLVYLLAIPPSLFDEFFVTGKLVTSSATETAANLLAHERLFRMGIAGNVFVFAIDAVLIVALFLVLERVHRGLALVAIAWGIIETTLLAVSALSDLEALRLLSGSAILSGLAPSGLHSLARSALRGHATAYSLGLVFSGLRGTAFGVLWFRSGLIPKALAVWAILASALLGAWTFAFIPFPELHGGLSVVLFGAPILLFELTMGIWLLVTNRAAVAAR